MTTTAEQVRAYKGPAVLTFGFRPFFLAGALWGGGCRCALAANDDRAPLHTERVYADRVACT
jgi:hypothetical protein